MLAQMFADGKGYELVKNTKIIHTASTRYYFRRNLWGRFCRGGRPDVALGDVKSVCWYSGVHVRSGRFLLVEPLALPDLYLFFPPRVQHKCLALNSWFSINLSLTIFKPRFLTPVSYCTTTVDGSACFCFRVGCELQVATRSLEWAIYVVHPPPGVSGVYCVTYSAYVL